MTSGSSPIIVTSSAPPSELQFRALLRIDEGEGLIIYPGKLTVVDSFRIGCIGQLDAQVMEKVVAAAAESLAQMGVDTATPPALALAERARLAA